MLASPRGRWNTIVAAALVLGVVVGLWPALRGVHHNWSDKYGHFSHGYLVLAMALWLAWSFRRDSPPVPAAPAWNALPLLALFIAAMVASQALSIDTITQSLLPPILLLAISAAYGWRVGRMYFWPVCFVYAALPVWWLINTPLQQLTAFVANVLVRLTGIPAFVEGNSFHLPAGIVQIAAGCSGLSYLNAAVALALFQGLQYLHSWKSRLKLLALTVLLALAFNWLRVYSLIVIAYASDMQNYLIRVDHLTYGWVLFAFCIWPVFWYGVRLERRQGPALVPRVVGRGPVTESASGSWQSTAMAGAAAVALMLAPAAVDKAVARSSVRASAALSPPLTGSEGNWLESTGPLLAGAEESQLTATVAGEPVWVYRALDRAGSVSKDWPVAGPQLLRSQWQAGAVDASAGQAAGIHYQEQQGRLRDMDVVVRSGLQVGGVSAPDDKSHKLAMLKGLGTLRQDAVLWMAVTPCRPDCATASGRLDAWMTASGGFVGARQRLEAL